MEFVDSIGIHYNPLQKTIHLENLDVNYIMCFRKLSDGQKTQQTVLFDLDGTLIDTAPDMIYALKTVLQNNNINTSISDKTLRKYVSDGSIGLINLVFPK